MGFFDSLKAFFSPKKKEEKKEEEKIAWDSLNYGKPAQPKNATPIDLDPWKT